MKTKKFILISALLIFILTACSTKKIDLSGIDINSSSITLNGEKYDKSDKLIEVIKNKTKFVRESSNDTPTNISKYDKIIISKKDNDIVLYLFEDKNEYYIEQPYTGVWKIEKEDYENLVK